MTRATVPDLLAHSQWLGAQWEAAYAAGDLDGMDAAMDQIRATSRALREAAERR